MKDDMLNKWFELMKAFGFDDNMKTYNFILDKHSESHRAYHNMTHVQDCLFQLNSVDLSHLNANEIKLAFWFHDIIYNSYGKDNELKSAMEARKFLEQQETDEKMISRIFELIMVTKHDREPNSEEEALIVDVDISILGRSEEEYNKYIKSIRSEYKLIPYFIYKKKRKEIMKNFLKRDRIYTTEYFHKSYEEKARLNISNEIKSLEK